MVSMRAEEARGRGAEKLKGWGPVSLVICGAVALAFSYSAPQLSTAGGVELLGDQGAETKAVQEAFLKGLLIGEQNSQEVAEAQPLSPKTLSPTTVHQRHVQHRQLDSSGSNRKELSRYDSILTLPKLDSHGDPVNRHPDRESRVRILASRASDELKDLSAKASVQQMNVFYNSLAKEQVAVPTGHEKKGLPLENKRLMKKLQQRALPARVKESQGRIFKKQLNTLRRAILNLKSTEGKGGSRGSNSLRAIQDQIHDLERNFPKDATAREIQSEKAEIRKAEEAQREQLKIAREEKICRTWMDKWSPKALGGMEKSCPPSFLSNKHDREQLVLNNHVAALLHRCMGGPGNDHAASGAYQQGVVVSGFIMPWKPVGGVAVHSWVEAKPAGDGMKNLGIASGKPQNTQL